MTDSYSINNPYYEIAIQFHFINSNKWSNKYAIADHFLQTLDLKSLKHNTFNAAERFNKEKELFQKVIQQYSLPTSNVDMSHRHYLCRYYSFAITDPSALEIIAKYSPNGVIDYGAGTGYWAFCLRQMGVDTVATDIAPPMSKYKNDYNFQKQWSDIIRVSPTRFFHLKKNLHLNQKTLFLCWPPYNDSMAYNVLKDYQGDTLIYIGESYGGCTANGDFFGLLEEEWEEVERYNLLQWEFIHDNLFIYKRK